MLVAAAILLCGCLPAAHAQDNSMMMTPLAGEASPTPGRVDIPRIPQITVAAVPGYGVAPLVVGFLVSSSDPEAVFQSYMWNFGDGQVSTLPPLVLFHTFQNPGTYVVSVTVTTADGHQASGFAGVIVKSATGQ
jgi:PKD repeat protein